MGHEDIQRDGYRFKRPTSTLMAFRVKEKSNGEEHMNSQEKTFETIAKLKDIELELLRLRNALDMANKIIDARERNFCERCGKRTRDLTVIHTCTPPQEKNT